MKKNNTPIRPVQGVDKIQQVSNNSVPEVVPASDNIGRWSEANLKKTFFFSLLAMLIIIWCSGFNVGFHNDELDMNNYGRANYAYYTSGCKDTSCLGTSPAGVMSPIRYYGWGFDMLAVGINKITGIDKGPYEINSRHMLNQLFGVLCIAFAGLIAARIRGWKAGILASWLIFLSPSFIGHAYFNTKDIPFAAGYIASVYFIIRFLDELPRPTWKTTICLMLSFYFTTNMRIGGLLLLLYLMVFTGIYLLVNKSVRDAVLINIKSVALKYFFVCAGGVTLLILTWPFLLMDPVHHLVEAVDVVKKFPVKNFITFERDVINSLELPPNYIPKLLLITTPVLVWLLTVVAVFFLVARARSFDWKVVLLVIVSSVFPIVYGIVTEVAAYGGWRHFLFVYPGICIIAAIGLAEAMNSLRKPALQLALGAVCLVGLYGPVSFSIRNNPYLYCYFNEIAGGFKKAYYNYDTDYWMISDKESIDWLMKHEHIAQSKDTVVIATNMDYFLRYYIPKQYPGAKVKVVTSGVIGRNAFYWKYGLFNTLFMKPGYLEECYPLGSTIHTIDIEGMPVTSILKDTARLDYHAIHAIDLAKYALADSLFTAHISTTHDSNPGLASYMSLAKSSMGQNDSAIALSNKCLKYEFHGVLNYNAYCGMGIAYANKGDYKSSIEVLKKAEMELPNGPIHKNLLQQIMYIQGLEKAKGK